VGAGRVRDLFKKARKAGKCVIFIDEIDALGKRRDEGNSDERDQTLNALLSEMSGFSVDQGIIVLAATNRLETLDPALLRPGRFDRQIHVGLPGVKERLSILQLHSKNKPLAADVDLAGLARDTCAFSGASLESLLNEAAILAAGRDAGEISGDDVRRAFYKTVAGADRESTAGHGEKCVIALHEAGHALALRRLMPGARLARITILPSERGAAGYNLSVPEEKNVPSQLDLENQVQVLLAGRAAEMLIMGDTALTAGASGDLSRATELVGNMVMDLGMGMRPYVSERALNRVCGMDGEARACCRETLARLFEQVTALLHDHAGELVNLTQALVEKETLTGEEAARILGF